MMGHSESENKKREGREDKTIHISHRKEVISFALMTACRRRGKGGGHECVHTYFSSSHRQQHILTHIQLLKAIIELTGAESNSVKIYYSKRELTYRSGIEWTMMWEAIHMRGNCSTVWEKLRRKCIIWGRKGFSSVLCALLLAQSIPRRRYISISWFSSPLLSASGVRVRYYNVSKMYQLMT